jgi:hypothetical protein
MPLVSGRRPRFYWTTLEIHKLRYTPEKPRRINGGQGQVGDLTFSWRRLLVGVDRQRLSAMTANVVTFLLLESGLQYARETTQHAQSSLSIYRRSSRKGY